MDKVNSKLLLSFAAALFMLQDVSAMIGPDMLSDRQRRRMQKRPPAQKQKTDASPSAFCPTFDPEFVVASNSEFDLAQSDWKEKFIKLKARRAYLQNLQNAFNDFIALIGEKAVAFENEVARIKGISPREVQNLSIARGDFEDLSGNEKVKAFVGTVGMKALKQEWKISGTKEGAFEVLVRNLQPYLAPDALPHFASDLEIPLRVTTLARIPCPGCADSMYRLALLIRQALKMRIDDPFRPLPENVADIFKAIYDKVQQKTKSDDSKRFKSKETYLPHEIEIADSLGEVEQNIDRLSELSEQEFKRAATQLITSEDIASITEILNQLMPEESIEINSYKGKPFVELLDSMKGRLHPTTFGIFEQAIRDFLRVGKLDMSKYHFGPSEYQTHQREVGKLERSRISMFEQEEPEEVVKTDEPRPMSVPAQTAATLDMFTEEQLSMELTDKKAESDKFDEFINAVKQLRDEAKVFDKAHYNALITGLEGLRPYRTASVTVGRVVECIDEKSGTKVDKDAVKKTLLDIIQQ